jgi:phosphoenolpyruvate carboxykinase (ATP)
MYHFLSGYTAKVAGTERGVTEPTATFSTCFGASFMALSPTVYVNLLRERITRHRVNVWLVNTGWSGGPYGVGERMKIGHTGALMNAALSGALDEVPTVPDPIFGVGVPTACPDILAEVLWPRKTWADPAAYDGQAHTLAGMFAENFTEYLDRVDADVRAAGPRRA